MEENNKQINEKPVKNKHGKERKAGEITLRKEL